MIGNYYILKKALHFFKGSIYVCGMLLLLTTKADATHIVGGDITYQHISGNNYRITLNLFIDCIQGNPTAIESDRFAIIGVFNASGTMVKRLEIERNPPVRIQELNYRCATNEPNQCVDHYVYQQIVNLPPSAGGYTLAFQRCCRNNSIKNLIDPGGTGATYWTKIPDVSVVGQNSSPTFDAVSPNFLCTNAPFIFQQSATDPDGDSLVYELYQPYDGGDDNTSVPAGHFLSPRPDPPLGPPYNNILWINPYKTNDMMGGAPILTMDSETGEIYVVPKTVGQFVVGFKVKEYRNGVLIGETLRDFQFNVLNCVFEVVSNFTYTLSCDNTLSFNNLSFSRDANDPPVYQWDLGLPGSDDESTVEDFVFKNAPAGSINVRLIASNTKCTDTFIRTIIIPPVLQVSVDNDKEVCDGESYKFTASSNVLADYEWHNGAFGRFYTSNVSEDITVIAKDKRGCLDTTTTSLLVKPLPIPNLGEGLNICRAFVEELDAGNPGASYQWNTGEKTRIKQVAKVGFYSVVVNLDGCIIEDSIRYTDTARTVDLGPDSIYCKPISFITDAGAGFVRYTWQDGSKERTYFVDTTEKIYVEVEDEYSCQGSDTVNVIIVPFYDFDLGDGENICKEVFTRTIDARNEKNEGASYQWNTSPEDTLGYLEITKNGMYIVTVSLKECTKIDTIIYSDTNFIVNMGDDTALCSDEAKVTFDPGEFVSYLWQDGSTERTYIAVGTDSIFDIQVNLVDTNECLGTGNFELTVNRLPHTNFNNPDTLICVAEDLILDAGDYVSYLWHNGSTDRILATRKEGANYVTLTDTNGCINTDTIYVEISKNARNTDLFIPNAFSPNGDGLNDEFPYDFPIEDRRDFSLMIFTRWGEKVFESHDPTELWDGTISKDEWKFSNTFIYIMQWKGCDGKLELEKGIVMVLR